MEKTSHPGALSVGDIRSFLGHGICPQSLSHIGRFCLGFLRRRRAKPRSARYSDCIPIHRTRSETVYTIIVKALLPIIITNRLSDGQIRTLQRRIKLWRVTEGPAQEVYFGQKHTPGRLCASDFTHMTELGITLENEWNEKLRAHAAAQDDI